MRELWSGTHRVMTVIAVIALLSVPLGTITIGQVCEQKRVHRFEDALTTRAPIIITKNQDFQTQGWPGNGSAANPYTINDLEISSDSDCISISNTSVYFAIVNCTLNQDTTQSGSGIDFVHVTNGVVSNVTVVNKEIGISFVSSQNCSIGNSRIENCGSGVEMEFSSTCDIRDSTAQECANNAFSFRTCEMCVVSNSRIESGQHGTFLNDTSDMTLENNLISNCSDTGVHIIGSDNISFVHNQILFNGVGIDVEYSYDISAFDNCFISNLYESMRCYICGRLTFANNTVADGRDGILVDSSDTVRLTNNTVVGFNSSAIRIIHSIMIVLSDCAIGNSNVGVWSEYSQQILVLNCTLINNMLSGMMSLFCSLLVIENCSVLHNREGAVFINSANSQINQSTLVNNTNNGVFLYKSTSISISQNSLENNNGSGVFFSFSKLCTVLRNVIERNCFGVYLSESEQNTIFNNSILWNEKTGILLQSSYQNLLFQNRIGWNGYQNAVDNGYNNSWTDVSSSGNYWSDYCGYGPYFIPGLAGSMDRQPMALEPTNHDAAAKLLVFWGAVLLIILLLFLIIARLGRWSQKVQLPRVCMVFPGELDGRAGDSRRVIAEASVVHKKGISIDIVCGSKPDRPLEWVRYYLVPRVAKEYSNSFLREALRALRISFTTGIRVISSIISSSSDAVHVHSNHPVGMVAGLLGGKLTGSKCILDMHDLIPETALAIRNLPERSSLYWVLVALEKFAVRMSSQVIVTSEGQERIVNKRYPHRNVTIVYNPVHRYSASAYRAQKAPGQFAMVYLGELQQCIRGLEHLIEEFSEISGPEGSSIKLLMIGSGNAEQQLQDLARQKGCSERVRFMGRMDHDQATELMLGCDLAVIPYPKTAATETVIPTKLLEAMSLGMPILATDTRQFRQVIGPDGFYFDPKQSGSLRKKVLEAIEKQRSLPEIGERMMVRAKGYLWENSSKRLEELYSNLLPVREPSQQHNAKSAS